MLNGTPEQAEEGLRQYRAWTERRAQRIASGSKPQFQILKAESAHNAAGAEGIIEYPLNKVVY